MVTHTRNSCSEFNPSKVHTHSREHTHTVNTHPEQWAAIYVAAPGEQLGARCLAQGYLNHSIEGGESAGHSLPPPTIPASPRLELNPLDYESDSLTIRPFYNVDQGLWTIITFDLDWHFTRGRGKKGEKNMQLKNIFISNLYIYIYIFFFLLYLHWNVILF